MNNLDREPVVAGNPEPVDTGRPAPGQEPNAFLRHLTLTLNRWRCDWFRRDKVNLAEGDIYDDDPWAWPESGPTVGYCSKCREARDSFYTCRDGGHTVPKEKATDE